MKSTVKIICILFILGIYFVNVYLLFYYFVDVVVVRLKLKQFELVTNAHVANLNQFEHFVHCILLIFILLLPLNSLCLTFSLNWSTVYVNSECWNCSNSRTFFNIPNADIQCFQFLCIIFTEIEIEIIIIQQTHKQKQFLSDSNFSTTSLFAFVV